MRLEKRRAGPFLRDNSTFSPKTVSDSESTFPRIYKKNSFSRHKTALRGIFSFRKCARLLSFLFSLSFLDPPGGMSKQKKVLHTLPDSPREKLPQNKPRSGIWADRDFFTPSHPLDLPLGKTVDYLIPIRKREDSPRNSFNWRDPSPKRGTKNMILATQDCLSAADSCAAWIVIG